MQRISRIAVFSATLAVASILLCSSVPATQTAEGPPQREGDSCGGMYFKIADPDALEFPKRPRTDLSVNVGGGKGVVIAPHWVLTASHCISSRQKGVVPVRFVDSTGKKRTVMSDKVIRAKSVDIALVRLVGPAQGRMPILLLKDGFPITKDRAKPYLLKKVAGNASWDNIPARVSQKSRGERFYVSKPNRRGGAGTSGSPWVIHSPLVGDVLVGVTHGTGRIPQVGKVCEWVQSTVSKLSEDTLIWATPEQVLSGRTKGGKKIADRNDQSLDKDDLQNKPDARDGK